VIHPAQYGVASDRYAQSVHEAIDEMALLEQQWVTVQQKTFTKWSAM